jgi:RimJ/RimL family protein N-acetyltransferase
MKQNKDKLMSLEYALERFPLKVMLKDGTECVMRALGKRDEAKLQKFFMAVPEPERLFIKKPVTDRTLLREWCQKADFEQNLPLLMLHGAKIIGEVTLHQRLGGWKRHIGLVTVLTHPDYRGRDVAKILVDEIVLAARHLGLKKLEVEVNGERKVAIRALEQLGFQPLYQLPEYVIDMQARPHDYVVMGMDLRTDEEYAAAG